MVGDKANDDKEFEKKLHKDLKNAAVTLAPSIEEAQKLVAKIEKVQEELGDFRIKMLLSNKLRELVAITRRQQSAVQSFSKFTQIINNDQGKLD